MSTHTDPTMELYQGMVGHTFHGRTPVRLEGTPNHHTDGFPTHRFTFVGLPLPFPGRQWQPDPGHRGPRMTGTFGPLEVAA